MSPLCRAILSSTTQQPYLLHLLLLLLVLQLQLLHLHLLLAPDGRRRVLTQARAPLRGVPVPPPRFLFTPCLRFSARACFVGIMTLSHIQRVPELIRTIRKCTACLLCRGSLEAQTEPCVRC